MLAELADFQFEIQFRSGKSNVAADVLSWKSSDSETVEDDLTINTQHELQVFMKEISHMKYMHLWNAKVTSLKTLDLHTCLKLKHCSQIWRV